MKILKFTLLTALAAATALTTMSKAKRRAAAEGTGSVSGYDDGMEDSMASRTGTSGTSSTSGTPGSSSRMAGGLSGGTSSDMSPGMASTPGGGASSPSTVTVTNAGMPPGGATSPVVAGIGAEDGEPATADVTETSSVDEPRPNLRSVGNSGDTGSRKS